jgi:preprotein translocase SecF subunit
VALPIITYRFGGLTGKRVEAVRTLVLLGLVGLAAQLVDGSLGMGFGATSTTLLLAMGTSPALASATVHLTQIGTTLASGLSHWRFGNLDWRVVRRIGIPGGIGAFVGATFLSSLSTAAATPLMAGVLFVLGLYILIRFKKWYFSAGAVAALFHDVVIVLGVFTILAEFAPFDVTIGQSLIAAFLTIVGYSLNDTVVVFDRIRENSIIYKTMEFKKMINKSLNDTLSRTVITSVTTLFVVSVLFIFGGEVLKGFAFALVIGVILGTYSSLFVASALVVLLEQRRVQAKS